MKIIGTDKSELQEFINLNDKLKNAYFWGNNGNAKNREYREQQLTKILQFTVDGIGVEAEIRTTMSRNNTYVRRYITVNGQKKDIRYIKKIVNSFK